jgi:hypothetical protein
MTIDSTTGSIAISTAGTVGNTTIVIYGDLSNKQAASAVFLIVGDTAPSLTTPPAYVTVALNS